MQSVVVSASSHMCVQVCTSTCTNACITHGWHGCRSVAGYSSSSCRSLSCPAIAIAVLRTTIITFIDPTPTARLLLHTCTPTSYIFRAAYTIIGGICQKVAAAVAIPVHFVDVTNVTTLELVFVFFSASPTVSFPIRAAAAWDRRLRSAAMTAPFFAIAAALVRTPGWPQGGFAQTWACDCLSVSELRKKHA